MVKVGEKTFPVEIEEVGEATVPTEPISTARLARVEPPLPSAEAPAHLKEKAGAMAGAIQAPLPGKVISIKCKVGDDVNAGETVLVLESMKMENAITAPKSGRVKEVPVSEGATVALGDLLLVIE
jgi:biotin carboxyl carrier protein